MSSIITRRTADFWFAGKEKGRHDTTASRQWANRPDDERFTSLDAMLAMMDARTEASVAPTLKLPSLRPIMTKAGQLMIGMGDHDAHAPTHFSFGQLCQQIGAPAAFMRGIADDPDLTIRNLTRCFDMPRYAEVEHEPEVQALLTARGKDRVLRGVTGAKYGRIWDRELVRLIKQVTEDGDGRWEVPSAFRTPDMARHAVVDPTKEDTTLYAGDRDCFLFLVDQRNPIEVGKLPNGNPDLYFRGFYAWNGECGGVSNGCATFLYRMVCCNRIIWDQKGFQRFSIKHTANAAKRFVAELAPALRAFADGSSAGIVDGLNLAQTMRIGTDDEAIKAFLMARDLSPRLSDRIMARVIDEEGRPARTPWDVMQGITAVARDIPWQDDRIKLEAVATRIIADVTAAL